VGFSRGRDHQSRSGKGLSRLATVNPSHRGYPKHRKHMNRRFSRGKEKISLFVKGLRDGSSSSSSEGARGAPISAARPSLTESSGTAKRRGTKKTRQTRGREGLSRKRDARWNEGNEDNAVTIEPGPRRLKRHTATNELLEEH